MNGIITFFHKIFCLFVNLVPSASFCCKRKASKMAGGLQKSQFPNSLVNWEKFRSIAQACFQKKKKNSVFITNWEKLRSLARATLKNPKTSVNWKQLGSTA